MTNFKKISAKFIFGLSDYFPEHWEVTALDILCHTDIPDEEKIELCCDRRILDEKSLHLFSVACCREVQSYTDDKNFIECVNVSELFITGRATIEDVRVMHYRSVRHLKNLLSLNGPSKQSDTFSIAVDLTKMILKKSDADTFAFDCSLHLATTSRLNAEKPELMYRDWKKCFETQVKLMKKILCSL